LTFNPMPEAHHFIEPDWTPIEEKSHQKCALSMYFWMLPCSKKACHDQRMPRKSKKEQLALMAEEEGLRADQATLKYCRDCLESPEKLAPAERVRLIRIHNDAGRRMAARSDTAQTKQLKMAAETTSVLKKQLADQETTAEKERSA